LPACAREAQNKKMKLPNCRGGMAGAFGHVVDHMTGKKPDATADSVPTAVAAGFSHGSAEPRKV